MNTCSHFTNKLSVDTWKGREYNKQMPLSVYTWQNKNDTWLKKKRGVAFVPLQSGSTISDKFMWQAEIIIVKLPSYNCWT